MSETFPSYLHRQPGEVIHRVSTARLLQDYLKMSANPHNPRPGFTSSELSDMELAGTDSPSEPTASSSPSFSYAPGHEALQALLAFSSLHEKIRERRARERLGPPSGDADVWELEQFVLDEVLQLVSERALTLTGADGVAIALAEGDAFVCRASAGGIAPGTGARLDPNSGFSGACLRTGGIVRCDDSEKDPRVNVQVCRSLGSRSIVAIPIASSRGTIGLLEAFSAEAYGFNDSDVRSLNLLTELILAAMRPEEENRMAEISQRLVAGNSDEAADLTLAHATSEAEGENYWSITHKFAVDEPVRDFSHLTELQTEFQTAEPETGPETAPARLQRYPKTQKSRSRFGLVIVFVLLALVAALVAETWWKGRHRSSVNQAAPAPEERQSESAPPATDSGMNSPSSLGTKAPLRQLVTGIWNVSSPDSSTVIIDLQGEVQYEAHRLSDPERIYFDLHGTSLTHGLLGKTIEVGDSLLARVRIAQPRKGVSRVVLETNEASDFSVSLQSNPYRLVVEIRKAAKGDNKAISSRMKENRGDSSPRNGDTRATGLNSLPNAALPTSDLRKNNLRSQDLTFAIPRPASLPAGSGRVGGKSDEQLQTHIAKFRLVLDAGHGGWDLGTIGRKGLMEKDLVLDIVTRLGKLIENRLGADVIYTRQDDTYLPLEKRTEIANLAQADMFISVHANYSDDSSARGAETYYTNTYSSLRARTAEAGSDVALPENINWNNVDIREKVQQSRRFAVAVQQAMHRALAAQIPGMRNRGVKKASYVVLTGTSMPAILAEVSFVSSPADEDKLEGSSYRQSIAEGLFKGIAQYAATTHHVNLASASSKPRGL